MVAVLLLPLLLLLMLGTSIHIASSPGMGRREQSKGAGHEKLNLRSTGRHFCRTCNVGVSKLSGIDAQNVHYTHAELN